MSDCPVCDAKLQVDTDSVEYVEIWRVARCERCGYRYESYTGNWDEEIGNVKFWGNWGDRERPEQVAARRELRHQAILKRRREVTEQQWLTSADPHAMLTWLLHDPTRVSERKLLLYCVACCYAVSDNLGCDAEKLIEWKSHKARDPASWAMAWAGDQKTPSPSVRAAILREIVGNPFGAEENLLIMLGRYVSKDVFSIAKVIYDERRFDECPILADALEDAGCSMVECDTCEVPRQAGGNTTLLRVSGVNGTLGDKFTRSYLPDCIHCAGTGRRQHPILAHLRDPAAFHVRGCWAIDLILGKE